MSDFLSTPMTMETGGPYREPKPLSEIIPPDRRKQRIALIVIASMIAGATLFQIAKATLGDADNPPIPQSTTEQAPLPTVIPTSTFEPPPPAAGPLTSAEVERVVASHRRTVKQACWDGRTTTTTTTTTTKVTLSLIVGASGTVVSSSASGDDPLVASCVEAQSRTWQFPAHGERSSTIQVPFIFQRM